MVVSFKYAAIIQLLIQNLCLPLVHLLYGLDLATSVLLVKDP